MDQDGSVFTEAPSILYDASKSLMDHGLLCSWHECTKTCPHPHVQAGWVVCPHVSHKLPNWKPPERQAKVNAMLELVDVLSSDP